MIADNHADKKTFYYCIMAVIVLSFLIRSFTSHPVEDSGDAMYKWSVIKQYVLFGDEPAVYGHHMTRWAIDLPVLGIQKIFGVEAISYYVWPFLCCTLGALFVFLILERLRGWRIGLLGSAIVMLSPPMLRMGTQFLPTGGAMMYCLGALYYIVRWHQKKSTKSLLASSLFLFLSYGAKITSIYYFPAFLILIYLFSEDRRKSLRNCLYFVALFSCLVAVETHFINSVVGVTFGRMEAIQSVHPAIRTINPDLENWRAYSTSLSQYLSNFFVYIIYPGKWAAVLYYTTLATAVYAVLTKRKETYWVAIPFLFGFFAHAYAITSVFPFPRPEKVSLRYHSIMYVAALILMILVLTRPLFGEAVRKYRFRGRDYDTCLRILLMGILFVSMFSVAKSKSDIVPGYVKTLRTMEQVEYAKANNLPVFIRTAKYERRTHKRIMKYNNLYTTTRYYGKVPYKPENTDYDISSFPEIRRGKKRYILAASNGFVGDYDVNAVILEDF